MLVRVHATTVTGPTAAVRGAQPFFARFFTGLRRPKRRILGMELAGEVEAVGAAVTEFEVGDEVFGIKGSARTRSTSASARAPPLAHKPAGMTYEEAAAVCDGACIALSCLRKARSSRRAKRIVVYGASGSIGTAAVQLAKHFGAHVTAVCNTKNLELVRSLGADGSIDYTQEDFTKNGETYDVIFDAVGKHSFTPQQALAEAGRDLHRDGPRLHVARPARGALRRSGSATRGRRSESRRYTKEDVLFLKELIEAGKYRAVIDRRYPLEQVVEATKYVETQQKTGNVVLTVT